MIQQQLQLLYPDNIKKKNGLLKKHDSDNKTV